jgi:ankyrin repeat protein
MMKFLLDHGANPNPSGAQSAVCSAAACGENAAIELLAARGADLNRPNHTGHTPLDAAAAEPDTIALLRMLGADPAGVSQEYEFRE